MPAHAPFSRFVRSATKTVLAAALLMGAAVSLISTPAHARTYVSVGVGVGPGWGHPRPWGYPGYWGHGPYWRSHYWGPSWGVYAPVYAWDSYYEPPIVPAPIVAPPAVIYPVGQVPIYNHAASAEALTGPLGQPVPWSDARGSGSVTAIRDGYSGERYCREFVQRAVIDGRRQQVTGAACQTESGTWQVVPDNP